MYLDNEMKKVVMSFQNRSVLHNLDKATKRQTRRSLILVIIFCAPLAVIVGNNFDYKTWSLGITFAFAIVVASLCYNKNRKEVLEILNTYSSDDWCGEIALLSTDGNEHYLLIQLLNDMQNGASNEEIARKVEQAAQTPKLSQLSFVRELRRRYVDDVTTSC